MNRRTLRHDERGVALVVVLWVLVLLTVMAGSIAMTQRSEIAMTAGLRQEREARALVDAGIQFMLLQILIRPPGMPQAEDDQWKVDGLLHAWSFEGRSVWVAAMPETARIDLNMAPPELLDSLFVAKGMTAAEAEGLRDAILDWRDPEDGRRLHGAEDSDYAASGLPYGARDANFETVAELRQVFGMDSALYRAVAPALTIHTRQRKVNPLFASREVLAALPGMDLELLDSYLMQRDQARLQGTPVPMPPGISPNYLDQRDFPIYRIFAEVELPGGGVVQGEMVVDVRQARQRGYQVLERTYLPLVRPDRVPDEADDT